MRVTPLLTRGLAHGASASISKMSNAESGLKPTIRKKLFEDKILKQLSITFLKGLTSEVLATVSEPDRVDHAS